ncbi:MAG: sugar transferase [Deltaproteobacteria bacterium]|nr:sugar transferase [Deltaproteobacteria bacterium]
MPIYLPKKQLTILGGDFILIIASLYLAPVLYFGVMIDVDVIFAPSDVASIFTYLLIFYIFDFYKLDEPLNTGFVLRFALALVMANLLIGASFYLMRVQLYSGTIFLFNSFLILCFCLSWRLAFHRFLKHQRSPWRVVIIGSGRAGHALSKVLSGNQDYEIVGFLDDDDKKLGMRIGANSVMGGTEHLWIFLEEKRIDKIIVAITHEIRQEVYARLVEAKMRGVVVYDMASFYEKILEKIPVTHVSNLWFVYVPISGVRRNIYNQKVKRIMDMILSFIAAVMLFPVAVITALVIGFDSSGPVFFVQRRIGWKGQPFNLVKFRSMKVGAENDRKFAGHKNDPRITRVGKVIRLFRIDEIPQMWNVMKGDMSFIGPRALMEEEVEAFVPRVPYFSLRHSVRPGVTGWAQINYPHGATEEDALAKLEYDLYYIKNLSPILDLMILARTIRTVLFGKGAR